MVIETFTISVSFHLHHVNETNKNCANRYELLYPNWNSTLKLYHTGGAVSKKNVYGPRSSFVIKMNLAIFEEKCKQTKKKSIHIYAEVKWSISIRKLKLE